MDRVGGREMNILFEDEHFIAVVKPAGVESQSSRGFEPDMVSKIKNYLPAAGRDLREPYVGVVHRLDKPVGGIMVYAKSQTAAAALSRRIQEGALEKTYQAVVCGKLVDIVDNYVDYLLKDGKNNRSMIVDKKVGGAKEARLRYRKLGETDSPDGVLTRVEIQLETGRHHQIRVQFAGHGTPLWGDRKYNPSFSARLPLKNQGIALFSTGLAFCHPFSGERLSFRAEPEGEIFQLEYF